MDTSDTYVKMCEKFPTRYEWEYKEGDFYYSMRDGIAIMTRELILLSKMVPGGPKRINYDTIPLPRQDQLQEMIIQELDGETTVHQLIRDFFILWVDPDWSLGTMPHKEQIKEAIKHHKYINGFNSMEQLWLAFVMKEKYGKVWNGKDWVVEKEKK